MQEKIEEQQPKELSPKEKKHDRSVMIAPLAIVIVIAALILIFPDGASRTIMWLRNLLVNEMGVFYILIGIFFLGVAIWMAFSKVGKIRIGGENEKPAMKTMTWGILIFTSTMAADILFYSLHEWSYYYDAASSGGPLAAANPETWANTYPLFHWGAVPWSFYIVLAVIYAFMFYNKKRNEKQKISEALRPLFGKRVDGALGAGINITAIVGFLCGTATTFSVATPLMSAAVCELFGISYSNALTITILFLIAVVYTAAVMYGHDGISKLAKVTTIIFVALMAYFLFGGNVRYTLESGVSGIGNMVQNFLGMLTWTDAGRTSGFPQDWTVFYWAYWIAWCVATPFFIAKISKGRTIKNVVLAGGLCGLLGTYSSFIIFGNFGLYQQTMGTDIAGMVAAGANPAEVIIAIIKQLPFHQLALVLIVITMIGLYATTFDAITDVMSSFSYKKLHIDKSPDKKTKLFWALVFLFLPIALIYTGNNSVELIQTVSIIGAFPISIIIILIVISFIKEVRADKKHEEAAPPPETPQ